MKILQALVLGTFFVIVGALVTLFALGLRPGANSMRSTITVARPPAVVWRWVTKHQLVPNRGRHTSET